MADFFNRTLSRFCDTFLKVKDWRRLNYKESGMEQALIDLAKHVKDNKKRAEEEKRLYALESCFKGQLETYHNAHIRISKVSSECHRLAKAPTKVGSVFVGIGTSKYWNKMAKHGQIIRKNLENEMKKEMKSGIGSFFKDKISDLGNVAEEFARQLIEKKDIDKSQIEKNEANMKGQLQQIVGNNHNFEKIYEASQKLLLNDFIVCMNQLGYLHATLIDKDPFKKANFSKHYKGFVSYIENAMAYAEERIAQYQYN